MTTATPRTTGSIPSLDVRKLWRELRGEWKPDTINRAIIRLSNGQAYANGIFPKGPKPMKVLVGPSRGMALTFEWTAAGFNGERIWAHCQQCETRVAILYLHNERLRCRDCIGLRYTSQSHNSARRARATQRTPIDCAQPGNTEPLTRPPIKKSEPQQDTPVRRGLRNLLHNLVAVTGKPASQAVA